MMIRKQHKQSGFSLVEVMVSVAVVSFGMLGLAKLQSELVKETGHTKNKLQALSLIQQKTADLKQFETLGTTANMVAYQDIANDSGGTMVAGDYNGFSLTWCVDSSNCNGSAYDGDYYYNSNSSTPSTDNTNSKAYPDFKKVKLMVAWTNPNGETETMTQETIIIPKQSDDSGIIASASINLAQAPVNTPSEPSTPLPDGATDNGDGTSTFIQNSNTFIFDNATGQPVAINGANANYLSISGMISLFAGTPTPKTTDVDTLNISATSITCIYPYTAQSGFYACYFDTRFSGNVILDGYGTDKACSSNNYSFSNLTTSIMNQNFEIRKAVCP